MEINQISLEKDVSQQRQQQQIKEARPLIEVLNLDENEDDLELRIPINKICYTDK